MLMRALTNLTETGFDAGHGAQGHGSGARLFSEAIGAIALMLSLFAHFVAALIAIELAVITFAVTVHDGWTWRRPGGGFYSRDRKIGWELSFRCAPFIENSQGARSASRRAALLFGPQARFNRSA